MGGPKQSILQPILTQGTRVPRASRSWTAALALFAWALAAAAGSASGSGAAGPPAWAPAGVSAEYTAEPAPEVRERYGRLRDDTLGWTA